MNKKILLFALSFFAVVAVGATLYKWQDDHGVTHYSETPPSDRKAKAIPLQPTPATNSGGSLPATKSWQEKDIEFRKRRVERQEAEKIQEENEAAAKREAAIRKQNCIRVWQNLQTLQTQRVVYSLDEKGEPVYFDDARRSAEIEKAKQEIQSYCAPR